MEGQGKIKIMDLGIDEDFQVMDDVSTIEKDEEIPLVLEEETLCGFESNLVGEEIFSIPKLVFVNEENVHGVVTFDSKEIKVGGRSKKRNSDDLTVYNECEKCSKKYISNVFFKKGVIKCGKQGN